MTSFKERIQKTDNHILGLVGLMVVVLLIMAITKGKTYYTASNFSSMVYQFPEYGILAFGMMICMIAGGIDLSLVGIMDLSGVVAALIMQKMGGNAGSIILGCIMAVVVGLICGVINGVIIGSLDIPAMLVTLCTLQLYQGLALAITGGPAINNLPDAFVNIANGSLGAVPYVIFIFIAVALIVWFVMNCTVFGHEVYYIGSNSKAARYSGINTMKTIVTAYMTSGILGGISGILITSHLNSAKSSNGVSYTLLTLLIVVLGGVNPDGGDGKVSGVTMAIILLQMIANAFTIMRQPDTMKTFVNGVILVAALVVDAIAIKRRAAAEARRKSEEAQKANQ